ncbi:MAG: polymerase, sigma 37 subunit, RpsB/SigB [Solirubrobacterales bacterium]|nr:polymerase, sigma 37 subunit, RpsB/SigB [Solirubrobacterales bacterium]
MIKAVDRFDVDRGLAFSTIAVPYILGEIRRHFRDHGGALRVTRSLQEHIALISKVSQELVCELQRCLSVEEIARATNLSVPQVLEARQSGRHYTHESLDGLAGGGAGESDLSLHCIIGHDDEEYARAEARLLAQAAVRGLSAREREIIRLRFEQDLTQQQIADRLGVSQMQISRLLSSLLEDMRESLRHEPASAAATRLRAA